MAVYLLHLKDNFYATQAIISEDQNIVLEVNERYYIKSNIILIFGYQFINYKTINEHIINEHQTTNPQQEIIINYMEDNLNGIYHLDAKTNYIKTGESLMSYLNNLMIQKGFIPSSDLDIVNKQSRLNTLFALNLIPTNLIKILKKQINYHNITWCLVAGGVFFPYKKSNIISELFPSLFNLFDRQKDIDVYVQANDYKIDVYQIRDNIQMILCIDPIETVCNFDLNVTKTSVIQTIIGESQLYYHNSIFTEKFTIPPLELNIPFKQMKQRIKYLMKGFPSDQPLDDILNVMQSIDMDTFIMKLHPDIEYLIANNKIPHLRHHYNNITQRLATSKYKGFIPIYKDEISHLDSQFEIIHSAYDIQSTNNILASYNPSTISNNIGVKFIRLVRQRHNIFSSHVMNLINLSEAIFFKDEQYQFKDPIQQNMINDSLKSNETIIWKVSKQQHPINKIFLDSSQLYADPLLIYQEDQFNHTLPTDKDELIKLASLIYRGFDIDQKFNPKDIEDQLQNYEFKKDNKKLGIMS